MATRNGVAFPVFWALIDLTHPQAATFLASAKTAHEGQGDFQFSQADNIAGTQTIIKVAQPSSWVTDGGTPAYVLQIFEEADHHLALALVRSAAWPRDAE